MKQVDGLLPSESSPRLPVALSMLLFGFHGYFCRVLCCKNWSVTAAISSLVTNFCIWRGGRTVLSVLFTKRAFFQFARCTLVRREVQGKRVGLRIVLVRLCTRGAMFGAYRVAGGRQASAPSQMADSAGPLNPPYKSMEELLRGMPPGFQVSPQCALSSPAPASIAAVCGDANFRITTLHSFHTSSLFTEYWKSCQFLQLFTCSCHHSVTQSSESRDVARVCSPLSLLCCHDGITAVRKTLSWLFCIHWKQV